MSRVVIKDRSTGGVIAEGVLGETVHEIETGWYFPPSSVDATYLSVTERIFACPYKGVSYWIDMESPEMHAQNVAWIFYEPKRGYERIAGYIGFDRRGSTATSAMFVETVQIE